MSNQDNVSQVPQQGPQSGSHTFAQVLGLVLAAVAILFLIGAWNSYQSNQDHRDKANCHLERADAILHGGPTPPPCP